MDLHAQLSTIKTNALAAIAAASELKELEVLAVTYTGRKGELTTILRGLSSLSLEEKKRIGAYANQVREEIETALASRTGELRRAVINSRIQHEKIDVTLPPLPVPIGHPHPLRKALTEITDIFKTIGFSVAVGPEIETEWYNFEALNIPKDHPARDTQDTFFLQDGKRLLRTHTSPVQIHVMEKQQPPVRIVVPGRVYRNEATDATHSAVFHQIEGLAVDEYITFADLKGTLTLFVHQYFGAGVKLRFRPSHFQFTEPSAELDIQCTLCKGTGCRVCKNTGWLEMMGCGMVHPNVFKAVKYDSEKYSGFAFGMGVERLTMFKYGITDIRLFYENNLSFLGQFL